ncbi:alpha/beta hydrolase fold-domain-containing protein [Melanogaster broomeanus]|nr:alpha/beta hydrolase fold-domain-containing protein [Melanogaster broomeanus]
MAGQPIDPEILPRLDPEYVQFHNKYIAHLPAPHTLPWNPNMRNGETVPGAAVILKVGSVKDYDLSKTKVRVFTPEGTPPEGGWPVYCWYHGGGWTLGSISAENAFCSRICTGAKCVVATVDYRLAPEHPYPAAVEDSLETLQWVYEKGSSLLHINPARIALGGSSAGGNIAAILSMQAAQLTPPIPLVLAQLVVPVTDNTAQTTGDPYPSWKECANTVWLSCGRMTWFRDFYVPNASDRTKWDCSPIFAPNELLAKSPPTWVAVMELDILRDEGLAYAEKLRSVGVPVAHKMYMGAPHQILAMDGTVLAIGRELVADATRNLAEAFGTFNL